MENVWWLAGYNLNPLTSFSVSFGKGQSKGKCSLLILFIIISFFKKNK